jgi:precorrin-6A/cobalt-precorrin-6A reductase
MIESQGSATVRVLLLGGTAEAADMSRHLAEHGIDAVYSYAGRTATPVAQPIPERRGGFGGTGGLLAYLRDGGFTHLIDATHPFAAQITANAVAAAAEAGIAYVALERPAWTPEPGDQWTGVPDVASAVRALPEVPARVFLAIGRQEIAAFAAKPHHHYVLRLVDPPEAPLPLPHHAVEVARGPFATEGDIDLMRRHSVGLVVAKNAGGTGAAAKLAAARILGLPVILIDRPRLPDRAVARSAADVMAWLHGATLRGV